MASHNGPTDAPTDVLPALDPHVVVLFGATGDLAQRKLLPGLLHLCRPGLMPDFAVIGTSLDDLDDDGFRELGRQACEQFGRHVTSPAGLDVVRRPAQLPRPERGPRGAGGGRHGARRASWRASPAGSTT